MEVGLGEVTFLIVIMKILNSVLKIATYLSNCLSKFYFAPILVLIDVKLCITSTNFSISYPKRIFKNQFIKCNGYLQMKILVII